MVRVFFELNGQPRAVSVPDRLKAGDIVARPKAEVGRRQTGRCADAGGDFDAGGESRTDR